MLTKKSILILLLSLAILLMAHISTLEAQTLTIVFTGDMRGELENCHCPKHDFGGLPRRAKYIDEIRKQVGDILLLDVGDVLPLSTPKFTRKKISSNAFISFKAMEMMGYNVMNVGESDLVLGEKFLKLKEPSLLFPLISANIIDKVTGEPFFKPYVIITMKDGLRIGVLGLVNERFVINSEQLRITPHQEAASMYVNELRLKSDIVIVLGHLGLPYSMALAKAVPGIDIILSGHWDVEEQEPTKVNGTLIMSTVEHSRRVGRLDMIKEGPKCIYNWQSTILDNIYDGNMPIAKLVSKMPKFEFKDEGQINRPLIENIIENIALERPLKIIVFTSMDCMDCMLVKRDILPAIQKKYGEAIVVEQYDTSEVENYEKMMRLEKLYGVKNGGVPEVFVSRYVLMGKDEIVPRLDGIIQDALAEQVPVKKKEKSTPLTNEKHQWASSLLLSRFKSFTIYAVLSAGLLDGINPCAFATIVFFISFLAFVGYRKREMFFAGLSFTIAVFITYLLIGIGIFRFLRSLEAFSYITLYLNIFIAGLAFLLGVLNIVDYFTYRKTKDVKAVILKLPQSIKNRIHSIIGADFRAEAKAEKPFLKVAWIAFTAGSIVSVLESFCTGQVYFPTIALVLKIQEERLTALLFLILYNLAFIVPLIVVFFLGIFGVTSKAFAGFMERHLGTVKLSTGVLFFIIGTVLIIFK